MSRSRVMRLLLLTMWLAACSGAARSIAPDRVLDVESPGLDPFVYRIESGTHVLRFRATCTGCGGRGMFAAVLVFDQPARPPITLRLVNEGAVVHVNEPLSRCAEDDIYQAVPPRICTMYSPWGWESTDKRRASDTRVFDLVIENRELARDVKLSVWLNDPHE